MIVNNICSRCTLRAQEMPRHAAAAPSICRICITRRVGQEEEQYGAVSAGRGRPRPARTGTTASRRTAAAGRARRRPPRRSASAPTAKSAAMSERDHPARKLMHDDQQRGAAPLHAGSARGCVPGVSRVSPAGQRAPGGSGQPAGPRPAPGRPRLGVAEARAGGARISRWCRVVLSVTMLAGSGRGGALAPGPNGDHSGGRSRPGRKAERGGYGNRRASGPRARPVRAYTRHHRARRRPRPWLETGMLVVTRYTVAAAEADDFLARPARAHRPRRPARLPLRAHRPGRREPTPVGAQHRMGERRLVPPGAVRLRSEAGRGPVALAGARRAERVRGAAPAV